MNVILVEGFHDEAFIRTICNQFFADRDFQVEKINGLPRRENGDKRLNSILLARLLAANVKSVGLIVDGDRDPYRIWRRLQQLPILSETEPEIGEQTLPESGFVADCRFGSSNVAVGIWVMPDNHSPGQLEDFVLRLVPDRDPVKALAFSYITGLPTEQFQFEDHRVAKHVAHSWLSAYYPGWSFDDALNHGQLADPTNTAVGAAFLDWLRQISR